MKCLLGVIYRLCKKIRCRFSSGYYSKTLLRNRCPPTSCWGTIETTQTQLVKARRGLHHTIRIIQVSASPISLGTQTLPRKHFPSCQTSYQCASAISTVAGDLQVVLKLNYDCNCMTRMPAMTARCKISFSFQFMGACRDR